MPPSFVDQKLVTLKNGRSLTNHLIWLRAREGHYIGTGIQCRIMHEYSTAKHWTKYVLMMMSHLSAKMCWGVGLPSSEHNPWLSLKLICLYRDRTTWVWGKSGVV
ncbi:hypothetical protein AG1IA_07986 [Rhizoctonia solani AG-1 IA]|uniref:Uncharacterized protein n=1 Tax=Thanatephorus cucumeris (strain AG1-IA) TaxID=983506 RepID=L8WNQ3_THACA|nr:hypothetical protein AG1IA_07986 [Rhizoctonia solani AG-1 IA]